MRLYCIDCKARKLMEWNKMGYDNFPFLHVWDYIKNYYKLNKLISLLIYYLPHIKKKYIYIYTIYLLFD